MANYRTTFHMVESNGRKFDIVGTGTSAGAALTEAETKLALTVGTYAGSWQSGPTLAPGVPHAASQYSDAVLVLKKGTVPDQITTSVPLQNIANEYGTDGIIDITNGDIVAFASAYRDGDGDGGYSPKSGRFVK